MTKTVFIHPSDELYGADRVLVEVVEVLADEHSTVWLPTDVDYPRRNLTALLEVQGVEVQRHDIPVLRRRYLRPSALPALARRLWRTRVLLREQRPDVVYLNTSAVLSVAPLARWAGARVVVHVHESWSWLERLLLGPLLVWCDDVVAVSGAVAAALPRRSDRVRVVHNGVDMGDLVEAAAEGGDRGDRLTVVVASRWNEWKGHRTLLEAWGGLDRTDMHLVVLGGPPHAGAGYDVVGHVDSMAVPESVEVVHEVDDVAPFLRAADLVVVPSTRAEPFGLIAIEAAALGVAVYASRSGGLPEIIEDGVTGRLLPPGDTRAWRDALASADRGRLATQGQAARLRYERDFTRAAFARRLAAALSPEVAPTTAPGQSAEESVARTALGRSAERTRRSSRPRRRPPRA